MNQNSRETEVGEKPHDLGKNTFSPFLSLSELLSCLLWGFLIRTREDPTH